MRTRSLALAAAVTAGLAAAGCRPAPVVAPAAAAPEGAIPDAATGIRDPALAELVAGWWTWTLERSPTWATQLGVHRWDDRIGERSAAALAVDRERNRAWLGRARALKTDGLEETDAVTLRLLIEQLEATIAGEVCAFEEWTLNPRWNPVSEYNYLPELHRVETVEDGARLRARYRQIPARVDESIDNLRRGLARGLASNAESARRVAEMVKKQLEQPLEDWPLLAPVKTEHPGWPSAALEQHRAELRGLVEKEIRPAFARYLALVETEVLPVARPDDRVGLAALPNGPACYRATILDHVGQERAPEDVHAVGLREIERINGQMRSLGLKLFGTDELPEILARLRGDRGLYFDTAEAVEAKAQAALAAAKAAMPRAFGVLPKADCVVSRVPDYEAPYTTIAYYRPPHPDGSKPGEYFVNVLDPETRPRYEAEALAFHEAIPGHHLQIAIAQELPALPAFRKHTGSTAYVEGWALYTERLSDELGLYTGDLDRMGMLSYEAWRASRLVVDTGVHALGWSREQAVKFMLEHTALAENNIRNEVDRYITWPGQALAYKLGQLEILRLRAKAETALGTGFSLPRFHDAVLGGGAVSLAVLGAGVAACVAGEMAARGGVAAVAEGR